MAKYFGFDPVEMLESDYFRWAVRVAAFEHTAEQERKANEARQKK